MKTVYLETHYINITDNNVYKIYRERFIRILGAAKANPRSIGQIIMKYIPDLLSTS